MRGLFRKYHQWVARSGLLFTLAVALALPSTAAAALLDNPISSPVINSKGTTNYDATSDLFSVDASPLAILVAGALRPAFISAPESFIINIEVDATGALTGGVPGDDLVVTGVATVPGVGDVSGVLLTGEVTGFGFKDSGGSTDLFDFTFRVTGGQLQPLYPSTVGVDLVAEQSDFTGDFSVNIDGPVAKLNLGAIPPVTAALGDRVWEDLNANGIQDCENTNGNGILGDVDLKDPMNPAASDQGPECGDSSSDGAGIAGVPVKLFQYEEGTDDCTGDTGKEVVTGMDGLYLFPDLVPGVYCVVFGKPPASFCDTDGFELGAPQFTAMNVLGSDPENDSDADTATGKTGSLLLEAGDTNRTLDAGFICPAKIGDRVWKDANKDGLQDDVETGVDGVTVRLFECGDDGVAGTADDVDTGQLRVTDAIDGLYMFGAEPGVFVLEPGDYYVKFDPTTFPPDFDFTIPKAGSDDAIDSDCLPKDGITACTMLGSRGINLNRDCGLIPPPPPACDLELDKTCRVEPQPSEDIAKCSGKLQQFTVKWDGPDGITIDSVNMGTTSASGPVNKGDEVTFFGPYSSNDVEVNISGAETGQSKFHVSCSDDDFNGSDDCGKLAGDGKSNDDSLLNLWRLEGFVDADGQVLDCNPESDGEFAQNCTFTQPTAPNCDTLGKPRSLTFKYTGGACPGDNDQGGKADCSGTVLGSEMASIAVNTGNDYSVSPMAVDPDGLFTITRGGQEFNSNTDIDLSNTGGTQLNDVHTSCSAPLAVGDEFGAITLVAINGQTGGVDVTYQYVVTNKGDSLMDVTVTDTILGDIAGPFDLGSPESRTFTKTVSVNGTTVNVGTASGVLVDSDGMVCSAASAPVIVETLGPPPCEVTPGEFKLEDNKIKWKLTNDGDEVVTVESIELSAPDEFGAVKKVQLDGDIFKDSTRPMTWTFTDADFINDLKNRQIKVGDTKELTFETTEDFKNATADQISITVNFKEGCSVTFGAQGGQ